MYSLCQCHLKILLGQYVPVATRKDKSSSTRVTGLRVLVSAEGLALLKGKEEAEREGRERRRGWINSRAC